MKAALQRPRVCHPLLTCSPLPSSPLHRAPSIPPRGSPTAPAPPRQQLPSIPRPAGRDSTPKLRTGLLRRSRSGAGVPPLPPAPVQAGAAGAGGEVRPPPVPRPPSPSFLSPGAVPTCGRERGRKLRGGGGARPRSPHASLPPPPPAGLGGGGRAGSRPPAGWQRPPRRPAPLTPTRTPRSSPGESLLGFPARCPVGPAAQQPLLRLGQRREAPASRPPPASRPLPFLGSPQPSPTCSQGQAQPSGGPHRVSRHGVDPLAPARDSCRALKLTRRHEKHMDASWDRCSVRRSSKKAEPRNIFITQPERHRLWISDATQGKHQDAPAKGVDGGALEGVHL